MGCLTLIARFLSSYFFYLTRSPGLATFDTETYAAPPLVNGEGPQVVPIRFPSLQSVREIESHQSGSRAP